MATDPDQVAREILDGPDWWDRARRTPDMETIVNAFFEREHERAHGQQEVRQRADAQPVAPPAATPALDAEAEAILRGNDWWHSDRRTPAMVAKVEDYYTRRSLRQAH